ncbi:uncharacterized protein LOC122880151 [Siniperca chuatsi]|uniref:uncharacterized protein LOC122880151 n=1 Tax=Siniperca chuatsi TaxID=119488 RepID=UPI001CE12758|nr:uncharacterized protein LOC122880151 [Siniperca chuatsi]XP_044060910.1 uncharacterized protein LOC122880151 [Siniperca chuatsi]XP_044060911.1 uncharacterized protein LOC122880151 [Siniperca chuatsi]XP_044060912.1 uncharacterized protein LOC122880151 [Siniperca chuatsi]XP_044060913.1 uncharacterized protein LOC122880151 [Siniperca chuatsi]
MTLETRGRWRRRGDRPGGHGDGVLLAVIVVLSSVSLMETFKSQLTTEEGGVKREVPLIFPNIPAQLEDNAWYATILTIARKVTNQSCYACVQLPHGVGDSIPVEPTPLNVSETLGVMVAFTRGVTLQNRTVRGMGAALKLFNISITNYDGSTARFWNMSQITQQGIHRPIMTTNPTSQAGTVGFTRQCYTSRDHFLGTSACKQIVTTTCGTGWNKGGRSECRGPQPYIAQLNLTHTTSLHRPGSDNPIVLMPTEDGFGSLREHVWVCGQHVYQSLRPGWCGTCYLAKLITSVNILPTITHFHTHYAHYYLPHRARRSTTRVSLGEKGISGILPWWGTVNNAHKIDHLAIDLENLTALVEVGFSTLTPTMQGIKNVALQNRMALDLMLASQGGVCHIIGTDCCTYVPDITDHLNDLLHKEKSLDSQSVGGWDIWSWLTMGGWKNVLMKMLAPVLLVIVLFLLLTCCVIPCFRSMIATAIKSSMGQYLNIPIETSSSVEWIPPFDNEMI